MAHFAQLDDGVVVQVISVANADAPDEATGIAYCRSLFGADTQWLQCSYNANMRKQFAGVGFTYDTEADVFVAPKPFASWFLDANRDWQAPIPKPEGDAWIWNEALQQWQPV